MAILTSSLLFSFILSSGVLARPSSTFETRAVTNASLSDVSAAFSRAGIVPGVIPVFQPTGLLDVQFESVKVTPGINLTVKQVSTEPKFGLQVSDTTTASNAQFVIALVDPDAPTPQNRTFAQVRHLLGGGYHWDASTGALTNTTAALSDFLPPGPPPGSDPHRYLVLAYVQSEGFSSKAPSLVNASTPITGFNISTLSEALGLGAPFAGTFFLTGPEAANATNTTAGSDPSPTPQGSGAISVHTPFVMTAVVASALAISLLA
ncbi:PEBP-like protein [Favolaschia claudopus]|uniref:PEBP-like protein n=1 Tax=Favolaschia claudopus TaxID=2862362 RepID=A0AAW0EEJ7_9AGAR